jgi:hypothetical protein
MVLGWLLLLTFSFHFLLLVFDKLSFFVFIFCFLLLAFISQFCFHFSLLGLPNFYFSLSSLIFHFCLLFLAFDFFC